MFKSDRVAQVATAMAGAVVISTLSIAGTLDAARATGPGQPWIAAVPLGAGSTGNRTSA